MSFPPPSHLSAEAAEYLTNPIGFPTVDYADDSSLVSVREAMEVDAVAINQEIAGPWHHRADTIVDVPVVWFAAHEADFESTDIIVHFHGGSYFCGSPMANAAMIVPIVQRTRVPVVSVDYRLAPEHPFPASVDDSLAVVEALSATHTIRAIYGESAGGGLALTTAVGMRDAGLRLPDRLGLIAPWVDMTSSGDTYKTLMGVDPDFTDPDEAVAMAGVYASGSFDDPRASPLIANHTGLPPTLIQVGGREILLSDSFRTASAMRRAGVETTLDVWDGLWHVWHMFHHVPEAMRAFDELAAFLVSGNGVAS